MATPRYYDAYTVHQQKVAEGRAAPGDFKRESNGSADFTAWAIAIATVAGLYLQTEQLRLARAAAKTKG